MGKQLSLVAVVGLSAMAAWTGSALGAVTNYGNYPGSGSNPDIFGVSEESLTDPTPLFGAPIRAGNSLFFFPAGYISESSGGASDITRSTLSMRIVAKPGTFLGQLTIQERGNWSLTGTGTAGTSASASGLLSAQDLSPGTAGTISGPLFTSGVPASGGGASGVWDGFATINLTGLGIREILLTFENTLATTSEPGTVAFIRKSVVSGPSIAVVVPAPGAFALLGVFGVASTRRRRA
ncbi:MAG TPA: hypothetical protein DEB06_03265 [Phycisphaerales bacterium]|nr:hypothetical protein [Phycisphaerales bacterium]